MKSVLSRFWSWPEWAKGAVITTFGVPAALGALMFVYTIFGTFESWAVLWAIDHGYIPHPDA
ncbi:hypothetical protein ABZV77_11320 [Streptomyces sp. NPDC004732]|uniref:hypothetical protein n=1 Tax=Streptomyces sp. NPDC004732 TaxID=3154290 RepID=UPI0033B35B73